MSKTLMGVRKERGEIRKVPQSNFFINLSKPNFVVVSDPTRIIRLGCSILFRIC